MKIAKNILFILILHFVLCGFNNVLAQTEPRRPNFLPDPYELKARYDKKNQDPKTWKRIKTGGIFLTAFGTACITTGAALVIKSNNESRGNNGYAKDLAPNKIMGQFGMIGGGLALAGGITMWIKSNSKLKKLQPVSIITSANSAGLAYNF